MSASAVERGTVWRRLSLSALLLASACDDESKPAPDASVPLLTQEELRDPKKCQSCHPQHYQEWASSMHAYASDDPVFRAMNQRGQRETGGKLGDFCIRCHAPMAVRTGATQDGLNIDSVDRSLQGITCYFCHNAVEHGQPNNGDLVLADDSVMRGPLRKPVDPGVHGVAYAATHDGAKPESSPMCGACHDVVTPNGIALERTFQEYLATGLQTPNFAFQSCQSCHMPSSRREGPAAVVPGLALPTRSLHEHLWPAIDVALTADFPDQEAQRMAVACELANAFNDTTELVADPLGTQFTLTLETTAGHALPSGAAQDRRVWVEAIAYGTDGKVIYENGNIADQEVEEQPLDAAGHGAILGMLRDHIYDADGHEVHMFWEAAASSAYPKGYRSDVLPPLTPAGGPHTRTINYSIPVPPARFTLRLRVRPIGMDVLNSLVDSGDLEPSVLAKVPTFTVLEAEWTPAEGPRPVKLKPVSGLRCPDAYLCLLDPGSAYCAPR